MNLFLKLVGVAIWIGVGYFDWWVWSNLFATHLNDLGAIVGFGFLAFLSIGITLLGAIFGLLLMLVDSIR